MKIQIDDNWRIESDLRCTTLYYEKELDKISEKTGNPVKQTDQFYYPSVKVALQAYLRKSTMLAEGIEDLVERIDKAERNIKNICK